MGSGARGPVACLTARFIVHPKALYLLTALPRCVCYAAPYFRRVHSMDAELIDRSEAIQQRILQLRDSL